MGSSVEIVFERLKSELEDHRAKTEEMERADSHGEPTLVMDLAEERAEIAERVTALLLELDELLRDRNPVPAAWRVPAWRRKLRGLAA